MAAIDVFLVQDGKLVIEAESADRVGSWKSITVDGERSMLWDAKSSSYGKVPSGQTLSYDFFTDEAGNYSIALHSGRVKSTMNNGDRYHNGDPAKGERTDTGNDAYVSIVNVETGEVVRQPTKLFTGLGGADRDLKWGTTFDVNHKKSGAQVQLDANTQYRLEITGRSDGYALDRITLSNDGFYKNTNVSESPTVSRSSLPEVQNDTPDPDEVASKPSNSGNTNGGGSNTNTVDVGDIELTLINAATDEAVQGGALVNGAVINLGDVNLNQLNIKAELERANGVSVDFYLNGSFVTTESVAPYALFGDTGGNFAPGSLSEGQHTLEVVFKDGGNTIATEEVTFTIRGGQEDGNQSQEGSQGPAQDDPIDRDTVIVEDEPDVEVADSPGQPADSGGSQQNQFTQAGPEDTPTDTGDVVIKGSRKADDIDGTDGNDELYGRRGHDDIDGGAGADHIRGNRGRDELDGGAGNDEVRGGRGKDILIGGLDNDDLIGGRGKDVAVYNGERADYTVDFDRRSEFTIEHTTVDSGDSDDGRDTLKNIELVKFDDGFFKVSGRRGDFELEFVGTEYEGFDL